MLLEEAGGREGRRDQAEGRRDQNCTSPAWGTNGNQQLALETGTRRGRDEQTFGNAEMPEGM